MGSTQRGRRHRRERRLPGVILGLLSTVGGVGMVLHYRPGPAAEPTAQLMIQAQAAGAQAPSAQTQGQGSGAKGESGSTPAAGAGAGAGAPAIPAGMVLGRTVNTDWGEMQVGVTVKAGKVVSALALKSPHEASKSQRINKRALPILYQQTVKAQTAKIDGVSGATVSSDGYRQSLQSALDAAHLKAAG